MSNTELASLLHLKWARFIFAIKSYFTINQLVKLMLCFVLIGCGIGASIINNYDLYDYNTQQGTALFITTMLVITLFIVLIFDHGLSIAYTMMVLSILSAAYLLLPSDLQYLNNGWLRVVNNLTKETTLLLCTIFACYVISFYLFVYFLIDPFYKAKNIAIDVGYCDISNDAHSVNTFIQNRGIPLQQSTISAIEMCGHPNLLVAYVKNRYTNQCVSDLLILTHSSDLVSVIPKKYIQREYDKNSHKTKFQKLKDKIHQAKKNLDNR